MLIGALLFLALILKFIFNKGLMILPIGRLDSDSSPIRVALIFPLASNPLKRRMVVPEFPQSNSFFGSWKVYPVTIFSIFFLPEIAILHFFKQFSVDFTSLPLAKFLMVDVFADNEAIIKAL